MPACFFCPLGADEARDDVLCAVKNFKSSLGSI